MNRKINADIKPLVPGNIEFKPGINYDLEVEVSLSPKEQYYLPATIEMTTCPKCGKKGGQYFESVLQLRDASREIFDFVRDDVFTNRGIW